MLLLLSVVMSVIAVRSDPGLVAGAPMRLAGSQVMPTGPAPALDLRVAARGEAGLVVEVRLRGPDGRPARAEAVSGTLGRVTHAREDAPIAFEPAPDGSWRALVTPPAAGDWSVAVRAQGPGGTAEATLRL
jgi:nitrogen fixation protein FixH